MFKIRYIFCLMILFPLISNGSFPIQNYETQTKSIKENNPITNLIVNDKSKGSSTFGIVSLISGVLSILTIATFAAGWFALLSIIFGILGLKKKGKRNGNCRFMFRTFNLCNLCYDFFRFSSYIC